MVLRSYLDLCRDMASLPTPIVAERTGFLGLALLGLHAVGGIESGIALGQGFDVNRLLTPPKRRDSEEIFGPQPRVYIERLGISLSRTEAEQFFERRGIKSRFACQDRACCRGWEDMIKDPRRHFVFTRADEVASLTRVPSHDRPGVSLEWVRSASDASVHAAKIDARKFEKDRKRLADWRMTLSNIVERHEFPDHVRVPDGFRARSNTHASSLR